VTRGTNARPPSATDGFTNARTRIVGNRTGATAEILVSAVRAWQRWRAVVWHAFSAVAAVITPLGWMILVCVGPFLFFGYRWGWTTLVVLGYVGVAIAVVATGYLIRTTTLRILLAVAHQRVVAGDEALGVVTITNSRWFRSAATIIELPIGSGFAELHLPSLAGVSENHREFAIPARRRGKIMVGPARTVRADPLGVVRKVISWGESVELFVHPRTTGIASLSSGVLRDLEGTASRDITNSDVSFHALREYQAGDDRRYIHWKSTAKTGIHMVRQFEETRRSHIMIVLSTASSDYATQEEFELAVSAAGSLGIRAIRDVREVSVVIGEQTPEFARRKSFAVRSLSTITRDRLLDDLTVIELAANALSIVDIARVAGLTAFGVSTTIVICGSAVSSATLRSASLAFALGIDVIAIVCDPESAPGLRHVAGLWVLTIGFLEDLQSALSRVNAQ
jgi:hypothetical protein